MTYQSQRCLSVRCVRTLGSWRTGAALLLLASGVAWADGDNRESALRHFRTAWGRFQLSASLPSPVLNKPSDAITMRQEAIHEMRRAVLLAPRDPRFLESLGYLCVENQQPDKAESWYRRAAKADPQQPRVHYLLARLYAARVDPDDPRAAQACAQADEAYAGALGLDTGNGLLLVEAAHAYHRAGLDAEARRRLERALYRTRYRLYALPAPPDLAVEKGSPAAAWFALQQRFWAAGLSRAHEVARWCVSLGRSAEEEDRLGAAESHYQHAVTIGQSVARAEPKTVTAALVGLRCQEIGLEALAALERKRGSEAAAGARLERIRAAKQAALGELAAGARPPATSVKALLERQARDVERILALTEQSP